MDAPWIDVAAVDDLWEGAGVSVIAADREYALFQVQGAVYATASHCTHGHARLCEGFVEGHEVECPLHQGRFDLRSGQPTCAPVTEPVPTFAVLVRDGRVWLNPSKAPSEA